MKKFVKILFVLLLLVFLNLFAGINQKSETSSVTFKINNFGSAVNGSFSKFDFQIDYKKDDVTKSKFNGDISISSINTGINMRDNHLKGEDYFNEKKFPKMTFKSTQVKSKNDSIIVVNGELTIKSETRKISLDVKVKNIGDKTIFTTSAKLNRRNFKVGGNSMSLSDELVAYIKAVK